MPVRKYRSVAEMPGSRPLRPLDPENLRLACELSELARALHPWAFPPGVRKFSSVEEANEQFGLHLPAGDWDTLAGLVFDHFGYVPSVGEVAEIGGARIEVDRVVGRRIRALVLDREPQ